MRAAGKSEEFRSGVLQLTSDLRTHCRHLRSIRSDTAVGSLVERAEALRATLSASAIAPLARSAPLFERVAGVPRVLAADEHAAEAALDALQRAVGLVEQLLDHACEDAREDTARLNELCERLDGTLAPEWLLPPAAPQAPLAPAVEPAPPPAPPAAAPAVAVEPPAPALAEPPPPAAPEPQQPEPPAAPEVAAPAVEVPAAPAEIPAAPAAVAVEATPEPAVEPSPAPPAPEAAAPIAPVPAEEPAVEAAVAEALEPQESPAVAAEVSVPLEPVIEPPVPEAPPAPEMAAMDAEPASAEAQAQEGSLEELDVEPLPVGESLPEADSEIEDTPLAAEAAVQPEPAHEPQAAESTAAEEVQPQPPAAAEEDAGDDVAEEEPPAATPADSVTDFQRELAEAFAEESAEVFAQCAQLLARVAADAYDPEPLFELFRAFHTLKGSAAAVGLEDLSDELRKGEKLLETFWEEAKGEAIQVPRQRLSDFLQQLVESYRGLTDRARGIAASSYEIILDLDEAIEALRRVEAQEPAPAAEDAESEYQRLLAEAFAEESEEVFVRCAENLARNAADPHAPEPLYELFRAFHTLKGSAAAVGLEDLSGEFRKGEKLLEAFWEEAKSAAIRVPPERLRDFLGALVESYRGLTDRARGLPGSSHTVIVDLDAAIADLHSAAAAVSVERRRAGSERASSAKRRHR